MGGRRGQPVEPEQRAMSRGSCRASTTVTLNLVQHLMDMQSARHAQASRHLGDEWPRSRVVLQVDLGMACSMYVCSAWSR